MKKFLLIITLGTICSYSLAFQLPTEDTLNECFIEKGIEPHFLEKTKPARNLGGRNLHPMGVNMELELLFADYAQYLEKSGTPPHMVNLIYKMARSNHKADLLDCIFKNNSEDLEELKKLLEEIESQK